MERKAFLDQEAPPGYVAGVGRGATGFVTSAQSARFESAFGGENTEVPDDSGLLAANDDDEADRIYQEIDRRLLRPKKEEKATPGVEIETGTGVIRHEFSTLKAGLASVSADEWAALPEAADITRKNKRQRLLDQQSQRTYAAPDILIALRAQVAEIDKWAEQETAPEDVERRRAVLSSLRRTEPHRASLWIASAKLEETVLNFGRAKALIAEGCRRAPHNETVWLESVRLHRSEPTKVCKNIIAEALRANTYSEKLWMQAMDLENPHDVVSRKKIAMKALEYLPENSKLWQTLVDLEDTKEDKIRLLSKATDLCSDWSFWLALVALSDYGDARAVLNRARKKLTNEPRVWVAALQLEEREKTDVTVKRLSLMLAKGMKEVGEDTWDVRKWLDEASQAEKDGFFKSCAAIVENTMSLLSEETRLNQMIQWAETYASSPKTASSIYESITKFYPHNISSWTALFASLKKEAEISRNLTELELSAAADRRENEQTSSQTPKDLQQLYSYYENAISLNPELALFRLMYAKDKWILGEDVAGARNILELASQQLPTNEKIWLARVKLEVRNYEYEQAFRLSNEALDAINTEPRLWYKHIHLLRFCVYKQMDFVSQEDLLQKSSTALDLFPDNYKLYLQRSQILLDIDDVKGARDILTVGARKCTQAAEIHVSIAELDLGQGFPARARANLDSALLENPKSEKLWECKIRLEQTENDMITARQLVSKALKELPSSPVIWLQHLSMIQKLSHRKNAFLDALKHTNNATEVLLGIGVFFWLEGKFSKAKAWFDRALTADRKNGDAWGWNYCFFTKMGPPQEMDRLLAEVKDAFDDINKGKAWISVTKDKANLNILPGECLKLVAEKLLLTTA